MVSCLTVSLFTVIMLSERASDLLVFPYTIPILRIECELRTDSRRNFPSTKYHKIALLVGQAYTKRGTIIHKGHARSYWQNLCVCWVATTDLEGARILPSQDIIITIMKS